MYDIIRQFFDVKIELQVISAQATTFLMSSAQSDSFHKGAQMGSNRSTVVD